MSAPECAKSSITSGGLIRFFFFFLGCFTQFDFSFVFTGGLG